MFGATLKLSGKPRHGFEELYIVCVHVAGKKSAVAACQSEVRSGNLRPLLKFLPAKWSPAQVGPALYFR